MLRPSELLSAPRTGPAVEYTSGAARQASVKHHYIDDDSRDWPAHARSHHYLDDDDVGHEARAMKHADLNDKVHRVSVA